MKNITCRTASAVIGVSGLLRMAMNGAVFALLIVPASAFFMLIVSLDGSPSKYLLDVANSLTAEAPAGKVMVCQPDNGQPRMDGHEPLVLAAPCHMQPLDINDWAEESDRSLKNAYVRAVSLGGLMWLVYLVLCWLTADTEVRHGILVRKEKDGSQ